MSQHFRHAVSIVLFVGVTMLCPLGGQALADTAGTVHFVRSADSSFDRFTSNPTPQGQAWLREHYWRLIAWSPYFDERTSWYGQAWVYDDAYAIYKGSSLASQHPEWILHDQAGNKLYIPFGCSGGSCPQYAGDITNAEFRHRWIEQARTELAHGYRGLFIDDVNMEERVGNGQEQEVKPVDPNTGLPMSSDSWRAYMAAFMAEIRASFPSVEIVHNAIWFSDADAGTAEPSIRRELESADYINLERGVNDAGLTGGSGPWSLNAVFAFVDQIHALHKGIILDGTSSEPHAMEYNLASYFLLSTGNDAVSSSGQTPESFWGGFSVNLGEATDGRYLWNNLVRRDFTGGLVLVNPPGSTTQTVTLPTAMAVLGSTPVTSVTLPPASGAVLTGTVPAEGQGSTGAPPPTGTETTLETEPVAPPPPAPHGRGGGTHHKVARSGVRERTRVSKRHRRRHRHASRRARSTRRHQTRRRHHAALMRVSGEVRHATSGIVTVAVQRRAERRWVTVRRLSLDVSASGSFEHLLGLGSGRLYRVRAVYRGTSTYEPSRSPFRMVKLRTR